MKYTLALILTALITQTSFAQHMNPATYLCRSQGKQNFTLEHSAPTLFTFNKQEPGKQYMWTGQFKPVQTIVAQTGLSTYAGSVGARPTPGSTGVAIPKVLFHQTLGISKALLNGLMTGMASYQYADYNCELLMQMIPGNPNSKVQ